MRRQDLCGPVRRRLKRLPPPYDAHYGVVPLPPPHEALPLLGIMRQLRQAADAIARLDTLASELHSPWLISRILPRKEALSSSAVENTNSTLDELLGLEEGGDAVTSAARQVRDYARALEQWLPYARRQGTAIFTIDLFLLLHTAVMSGDPDYKDAPGRLRTIPVAIGGTSLANSTYNPCPPDDIRACLEQTVMYLQTGGLPIVQQSLITRMAVAHSHFEAVHPFRDGNGRVGRLILPLMMAAAGNTPLYLSPYIEAHKDAYYAALKVAQQRLEWEPIVGYLAEAVTATVDEVLETRRALEVLGTVWRKRRRFRGGSASLRALDALPDYPVITVERLSDVLNVSFPAAAAAVNQLTEARILVERTGYRRNRLFAAPEALAIINRHFGDEPVIPES